MKKVSKFFQLIFFFVAVVLIFACAYFIGREYLVGDNLLGNDTYSFYTLTLWIAKYFPHVPFWYPVGGGGVSLTSAYPTFAGTLVVILSKISHLSITQSFRLLGFSSIPLFAAGIFVFCWLRLKSLKNVFVREGLGLAAALFAVLSPASWIWLTRWGFYAESVSMIFVPWAILFFDIFLEKILEGKKDKVYRFSIAGCAVFLGLSFITHMFAAGALALFFVVWTAAVWLKSKDKRVLLKRLIPAGIFLIIVFAGLISSRLFSYQYYMGQVAKGGFSGYGVSAYSETANNTLPLSMALSLTRPDSIMDSHALIFDTRFNLYVWVLFALGFLLSIKLDKKIFAFGVYALLGLAFTNILPIRYFVTKIPLLGSALGFMQYRGYLIVAKIAITVVAGYGAFALWDKLIKFKPKFISGLLVIILGFLMAAASFYALYQKPYGVWFLLGTGVDDGVLDLRDVWGKKPHPLTVSYGNEFEDLKKNSVYWSANVLYMRDLCLRRPMDTIAPGTLCDFYLKNKDKLYPPQDLFLKAEKDCKTVKEDFCDAFYPSFLSEIKPSGWPKPDISDSVSQKIAEVKNNLDGLPLDETFRFDMSGYAGSVIMATPLVTGNSQIQIYINTASLIYNSWNYLSQVMYSQAPTYQKPGVLTELGKWFGLNYVFLKGNELEPLDYWKSDSNWQDLNSNWKQFAIPVTLTEWSSKPKVLVIADVKRGIYDQAFRFFNWGGLSFDTAYPVIGGKYIDDYSLNDLEKYDTVIMVGYGYKNRSSAYKLLDSYVAGGGKLVFDTGWQYELPDYILANAPEFMPFNSLSWKNLQTDLNFDQPGFGALTYGDGSWGVSVPGGLKDWAKPILRYGDTPLAIEGSYGKGKVVWFGFNIIPHSIAKDNRAEAKFFGSILSDLIGVENGQNLGVVVNRPSPDKIVFTLGENSSGKTGIYFRESYFPYWNASLVRNGKKLSNLPIEKVGPGFTLIDLPQIQKGDRVELEIKISAWQIIFDIISAVSLVVLAVYIVNPTIFNGLKPKIRIKIKNPFPSFTNNNEEENY